MSTDSENKKEEKLTLKVLAGRLDKVVASTNDTVDGLKQSMADNQDALLKAIGESAKNHPASRTQYHEAAEQHLGSVPMFDDGVIEKARVMEVESPEFKDKAAYEMFMQEPVAVFIHNQNDPDLPNLFDISVNGKTEVFRMGETRVVRRYIVEGLARAKPTHYQNEEYTKDNGERSVRNPGRTGLRFPFAVSEDRNPKGKAWLDSILSQP